METGCSDHPSLWLMLRRVFWIWHAVDGLMPACLVLTYWAGRQTCIDIIRSTHKRNQMLSLFQAGIKKSTHKKTKQPMLPSHPICFINLYGIYAALTFHNRWTGNWKQGGHIHWGRFICFSHNCSCANMPYLICFRPPTLMTFHKLKATAETHLLPMPRYQLTLLK